ncbi:MAG: DUF1850 domain-containing protein [Tissierellaceae bacterium]|nr:DUF1850 domain-containing protein [Tissierellaceae bacterium]
MILIAVFAFPVPILEILLLPENSLVFRANISKNRGFELQYTHSWDKTPVWDIFMVDSWGNLILDREEYLWMGAGLESFSQGNLSFDGDRVSVVLGKRINDLQLAVGTVANHKLIINSKEIPLVNYVDPGSKILIKTKLEPWPIFYLKEVNKNEEE